MQIRAVLRKTFGNHLFFTNVGISFGLSGVGDLIEQKIERKQLTQQQNSSNLVKKVSSINWSRTLHMSTAFGLTSGFLCHFWYNYLDRMLPGRGVRIIVQKIAWDQLMFSPVCIAACLVVAGSLEAKSASSLTSETLQLGGRLYLAEWLIWPPAQFINFYYLPTKYRVLYDNLVSLVYDTYTSHVKFTVQVTDGLEERLIASGSLPTSDQFRTLLDNDY